MCPEIHLSFERDVKSLLFLAQHNILYYENTVCVPQG